MKCFILLIASLGLALNSTAQGQSLQDRINHVKKQRANQQAGKNDSNSPQRMLGVLLYTDISVNFQESKARDVFAYLATRLDLTIIGRYSDDKNAEGYGIDPEAPITLEMENMPALTVLELALEQVAGYDETTWQMRRGFLEIGTKDRLSVPAAQFVKVYPIDDLIYEPPSFDDAPTTDLEEVYRRQHRMLYGTDGSRPGYGRGRRGGGGRVYIPSGGNTSGNASPEQRAQKIIDLILDSVEPMAWQANGGQYASIKFHDGALIVRAPDYIHRQIGGYPTPIRPRPTSRPTSSNP
ncbi:MAG: hypothetical protein O7G85_09090 [Planctomycetota bacterium]|nr:hypothetical protein [Planctomycetota bacterium]